MSDIIIHSWTLLQTRRDTLRHQERNTSRTDMYSDCDFLGLPVKLRRRKKEVLCHIGFHMPNSIAPTKEQRDHGLHTREGSLWRVLCGNFGATFLHLCIFLLLRHVRGNFGCIQSSISCCLSSASLAATASASSALNC